MKFDKLIQIMESRGIPTSKPIIVESQIPGVDEIVKSNFGLLLNDRFFKRQFNQIVSNFMSNKRSLQKHNKDSRVLHKAKSRLEKRQLKYEQDITKLATKLKDNTRVINHANMPPGEKEQLEREIAKLEAELKIAGEQLERKPHGKEVVKFIKQISILNNKLPKYAQDTTQYQKTASKIEELDGKLNSGKYSKAQSLISKVMKGADKLVRLVEKFKNSNSSPKVLSKIKSEIFDLNKTLRDKEKEYDKIMSELSEVINAINAINSDMEQLNTNASDKVRALVPFTANMILKSDEELDEGKTESLQQLANDDPNSNPILSALIGYENEYNSVYDSQDLMVRDPNLLPFSRLISVFKKSKANK